MKKSSQSYLQAQHYPNSASPRSLGLRATLVYSKLSTDEQMLRTDKPDEFPHDLQYPIRGTHALRGGDHVPKPLISRERRSSYDARRDTPTTFRGRLRPKQTDRPPSIQLACKRTAFIYQRLSTTEQKKDSRYSLEHQDDLEQMAREDGYLEHLIYVERRDLGISGTKGQEEREGQAYLIRLIEQDKVKSAYVIEIIRISRDQTLITGLQFGELCREHDVIIVTPNMRLNLREDMHMRMYRYEIDRAAEELKSIRCRMQGAKEMNARHGYVVGGSVPTGYIIDYDERLPNDDPHPNYQKYKIYEPHAAIARRLFQMMARPVRAGEYGDKLLITVLSSRTQPLIRYELKDSVRLAAGTHDSELPFARIDGIQQRTD